MKPLFHLHICRDGRALMANTGFTRKGGRLAIINEASPIFDVALRAVLAAKEACNPLHRIDMAVAAEAVQRRLGDAYRVENVQGDHNYNPRITVREAV
jgi:hypothetical protein